MEPKPGVTIQPSSEERAETLEILGGPEVELPPRDRDPLPDEFPGPDNNGEIDPPPPDLPDIQRRPGDQPDLPPNDLPLPSEGQDSI